MKSKSKSKKTEIPRNWTELAQTLGVSRQSVANWRTKANAPRECTDLGAWRAFVAENRLNEPEGAEVRALRAELLKEQIAKAKLENAQTRRELLDAGEVVADAQRATLLWQAQLRAALGQASVARLLGKDAAELRAELEKLHDELVGQMQNALRLAAAPAASGTTFNESP